MSCLPCCVVVGIPNGYPSITVNPELKAVEKDRQVNMQCEAIARNAEEMGRPNIFWIKDYIPVDMSDPRISIQDSGIICCEILYMVIIYPSAEQPTLSADIQTLKITNLIKSGQNQSFQICC